MDKPASHVRAHNIHRPQSQQSDRQIHVQSVVATISTRTRPPKSILSLPMAIPKESTYLPRDGENAANDGEDRGEEVEEGGLLVRVLHHDGVEVVEEVDPRRVHRQRGQPGGEADALINKKRGEWGYMVRGRGIRRVFVYCPDTGNTTSIRLRVCAHTDTHTDTHADRQTDRQTDRHTHTHTHTPQAASTHPPIHPSTPPHRTPPRFLHLMQRLLEGKLVVVRRRPAQGLLHRGDDAEVVEVVALPLRQGQEAVQRRGGLALLLLPDREVVDQVAGGWWGWIDGWVGGGLALMGPRYVCVCSFGCSVKSAPREVVLPLYRHHLCLC